VQAGANRVELVTRVHIEELLDRHPITNYEFDDALLESNELEIVT
jgi:hypothetical protein